MSNYNNYISNQNRYYGGPGSKPNDQVPVCFTCRNRGWPHEPIVLAKAKSGGYLKYDYITGKPHVHKDRKKEEKSRNQQKSESVEQPQELFYDHTKFNEAIEILIKLLDKWKQSKK